MNKIIKRLLNKLFDFFGHKIISDIDYSNLNQFETVKSNFNGLCLSYEYLLKSNNIAIPPNNNRIEILSQLLGTPPPEAYFIISSIEKTKNVNGDICEFGVAQGITSSLIANEILENKEKSLHLFDSFEGLPAPTTKDKLKDDIFHLRSIEAYEGSMSNPEYLVMNRLKILNFPKKRLKVHEGYIENLIHLKNEFPDKVSFAYIDFDFYEPIKIALDYLDQVANKGPIIIIDDYDYFSTGVKTAVDEFVNENNSNYDVQIPDKVFGCFASLTKL